jgi:hypothetical protein
MALSEERKVMAARTGIEWTEVTWNPDNRV